MKRVPSGLRAPPSGNWDRAIHHFAIGQLPAGDATWTFLTELMAVKVPFAQATDISARANESGRGIDANSVKGTLTNSPRASPQQIDAELNAVGRLNSPAALAPARQRALASNVRPRVLNAAVDVDVALRAPASGAARRNLCEAYQGGRRSVVLSQTGSKQRRLRIVSRDGHK